MIAYGNSFGVPTLFVTEKLCKQSTRQIKALLSEHGYRHGHTFERIKFARQRGGCIESSDEIIVGESLGSLGCFVSILEIDRDKDGDTAVGTYTPSEIYGITCAHIVGENCNQHVDNNIPQCTCLGTDVKINYEGEHQTLGNVTYMLTSSVDLAAFKIRSSELQRCCFAILRSENCRAQWSISNSTPSVGELVHKYGAKTGLTKGIISCLDFTRTDFDTSHSILVKPPADLANSGSEGKLRKTYNVVIKLYFIIGWRTCMGRYYLERVSTDVIRMSKRVPSNISPADSITLYFILSYRCDSLQNTFL